MALGATGRARERYQEVTDILERLARAEPDRADYQRDLSVSYNTMGDLFKALGQGEAARDAFQKALDIAERLARAEPDRADYQWDLVLSLARITDFEKGDHLSRALAILRTLDVAGRLYPRQRELLEMLENSLGGH
jgi:tetratricopeptide (TPR) repeat protein